jgi:hypothetical protein
MTAEISDDLVMKDEMDFVEGAYRVQDADWQVFIVSKAPVEQPQISPCRWSSGVAGVVIRLPRSARLNRRLVEQVMGQWLGVKQWREVRGPDSMQLR